MKKNKKAKVAQEFAGVVPKEKRYAHGEFMRSKFPLQLHAKAVPKVRPDPCIAFDEASRHRMSRLIPLRHQRMLESPFTFFRGSAGLMASDLALLPHTKMLLQVCGDCHLLNFGGFATPERKLIFDINDFDETAIAPWEWDVKRLATSFVIAGREKGLTESQCSEAAWLMASSYRRHISEYAEMSALQIWYSQIKLTDILKSGNIEQARQFNPKAIRKALLHPPHERDFAKLTYTAENHPRIKDQPPLIFHADDEHRPEFEKQTKVAYSRYLRSLPQDRRALLQRYKIQDVAIKVVGVGSVGSFCGVSLLMSATGDPLFLQFKEARQSVLEPFAGRSRYLNHGQRVVEGQRLIQGATDIFLGWTTNDLGQHFYVRQLRDAKIKPTLEDMDTDTYMRYAHSCGWALAKAHARTGDAMILLGYMDNVEAFEEAISGFASGYADQNEKDYNTIVSAIKNGNMNAGCQV